MYVKISNIARTFPVRCRRDRLDQTEQTATDFKKYIEIVDIYRLSRYFIIVYI